MPIEVFCNFMNQLLETDGEKIAFEFGYTMEEVADFWLDMMKENNITNVKINIIGKDNVSFISNHQPGSGGPS